MPTLAMGLTHACERVRCVGIYAERGEIHLGLTRRQPVPRASASSGTRALKRPLDAADAVSGARTRH